MPRLFRIGSYIVYFWANEIGEPVHVHISKGIPTSNATKVWLTQSGGFVVDHNKNRIPEKELNQILDVISTEHFFICVQWKRFYNIDEIKFYC